MRASPRAGETPSKKVLLNLQYAVKGPGGQKGETKTIRVRTLSLKVVEGRRFIEAHLPDMGVDAGADAGDRDSIALGRCSLPLSGDAGGHGQQWFQRKFTFEYPVQIPSVSWAYAWEIFVVAVIIILILTFARKSNDWGRWDPLGPTATPVGGYSVSLGADPNLVLRHGLRAGLRVLAHRQFLGHQFADADAPRHR